MGLMMMEELVRDLINAKCSYAQIVDAVRVRKPLGEDITEDEYTLIGNMVEESKIGAAVLGSEELGDYFKELESLDWFYDYSDDHSVWTRGNVAYQNAVKKRYLNKTTYYMFRDFSDYINGRRTKPEVTDYDF